jgi:hypothetical protein
MQRGRGWRFRSCRDARGPACASSRRALGRDDLRSGARGSLARLIHRGGGVSLAAPSVSLDSPEDVCSSYNWDVRRRQRCRHGSTKGAGMDLSQGAAEACCTLAPWGAGAARSCCCYRGVATADVLSTIVECRRRPCPSLPNLGKPSGSARHGSHFGFPPANREGVVGVQRACRT